MTVELGEGLPSGPNKATPCLLDRARSLALDMPSSNGRHKPKCTSDGSYDAIQCHPVLSQCWCVDKHGSELIGTRLSNGTPNCTDLG